MFGFSTMQSPVIRHLPSGEDFESAVLCFFPHPMKIKKRFVCVKKTWFAKQILSYVAYKNGCLHSKLQQDRSVFPGWK